MSPELSSIIKILQSTMLCTDATAGNKVVLSVWKGKIKMLTLIANLHLQIFKLHTSKMFLMFISQSLCKTNSYKPLISLT